MELKNYFSPVSLEKPGNHFLADKAIFCRNISIHTPDTPVGDLSEYKVAIVGIPEDRNAKIRGSAMAPDHIRNKLYNLYRVNTAIKVIDLGNLISGNTVQDTYFALRDIVLELKEKGIISIILGGSQDLTYGIYLAYEKLNSLFNFVTVDSRLDLGIIQDEIKPESYLIPILSRKKELLFNYTNLGHQKYLVDQEDIDFLQQQCNDTIRLGDIHSNISITEPILRDCAFVSFDMNAIRQGDAPGCTHPSPNGLYGEEACQISRYSGMGNSLMVFGIFNVLPASDINEQSSHLAAQMIWYFLEGVSQRKYEVPSGKSNVFKKFIVSFTGKDREIVFYKSLESDRWWFEVPVISDTKQKKILISCSHEDYQYACNQEIPDRWLKAFRKLN
jgi:arginase family enzyme